jgi:hypothetical protein
VRRALVLAVIAAAAAGCGPRGEEPAASPGGGPDADPAAARIVFRDATESAGIRFRHVSGATEEKFMPETLGSGVCVFDFDSDGWQDIYVVQSGSVIPARGAGRPPSALFRNRGDGRFEEVPGAAGATGKGYGMGCTVADIENDGDPDLYVTAFGSNVLYRNDQGRFTDITEAAGVADERWSASAAFGDYDADGLPDLYVVNYVDFTPENHIYCGLPRPGYRQYCHPQNYHGVPDALFRNLGGGRFEDVSKRAGVADPSGKGLGMVWGDFDRDGRSDIYVANDSTPNFLYRNRGDGTFEEIGQRSGVALGEDGLPQAGMGVAIADCDANGWDDIFVTNLAEEPNALYRNEGALLFSDFSFASGLGSVSLLFLGFGASFLDADGDGDDDLFVANGHILDNVELYSDTITFRQSPLFFENLGGCRFRDVSRTSGGYFRSRDVGRGSAVADFDADGDPDLVVSSNDLPPHLLLNDTPASNNRWISLALVGSRGRDALGARVELEAGGLRRTGEVRSAASYLSQGEPVLQFGLGTAAQADRVRIRWPGGELDEFGPLAAGRYHRIRQGEKAPESRGPGEPRPRR